MGRQFNATVFKARRANDETLFIEVVGVPIFGESGEVSRFWGAGRDVTERVKSAELASVINGVRR